MPEELGDKRHRRLSRVDENFIINSTLCQDYQYISNLVGKAPKTGAHIYMTYKFFFFLKQIPNLRECFGDVWLGINFKSLLFKSF